MKAFDLKYFANNSLLLILELMLKQKLDESIYEIADCVGTIQTAVVFSFFWSLISTKVKNNLISGNFLRYLFINSIYNIPKIQSCGCSICSDCETEIFKNNEALAQIECSICHEKFELPLTRFKINKHLNNFLDILPISVHRGGLHADAMQKLHDVKVLNENFLKEIKKNFGYKIPK